MLQSRAAVSLSRASLRHVSSTRACTTRNLTYASILPKQAPHSVHVQSRATLALVPHKPFSTSLQRYATHPGNPYDKIDTKHEEEVEHEKLEEHPEEVTESSSVHQVFHEKGAEQEQPEEDMLAGLKSDLVSLSSSASLPNILMTGPQRAVKETFALDEVPREALVIGMAGVLPYLVTSMSTVYLAFDINHASETGSGFLFSPHVAEQLLHIIEPLQVGYGAVVSTESSSCIYRLCADLRRYCPS